MVETQIVLHHHADFVTIAALFRTTWRVMKNFWILQWQILRFRQAAEALPSSPALLAQVILLGLLLGAAGQSMTREASTAAMIALIPLISVAVELVAIRLLTAFKSVGDRFYRTAAAVFGGDVILTLFSLPVLLASNHTPPQSPLMVLLAIVQMLLLGWGLGFRAFVYHRSLNIGLIQANMLALSLFLLTMSLSVKAFPELLAKAREQAAAAQQR